MVGMCLPGIEAKYSRGYHSRSDEQSRISKTVPYPPADPVEAYENIINKSSYHIRLLCGNGHGV